MEDDNTTPEANVPEENEENKPPKENEDFKKKASAFFDNRKNRQHNRYEKEPSYYHTYPTKNNLEQEPKNAYDEIVEDLIDIIAKLLKELSKKK